MIIFAADNTWESDILEADWALVIVGIGGIHDETG
jgi:hypothetical protein